MKKLFTLLLAMAMALNIGTMALAETQAAPTDAQATAQQLSLIHIYYLHRADPAFDRRGFHDAG